MPMACRHSGEGLTFRHPGEGRGPGDFVFLDTGFHRNDERVFSPG